MQPIESVSDPIIEAIQQPLAEMLQRYRQIGRVVEQAIDSLELAVGRGQAETSVGPASAPEIARIETPTGDLEVLLAFQERLAELEGVTRVTVAGSTPGRSTFLVELAPERRAENAFEIRCSVCNKVIQEGRPPASHGLCEDCQGEFGTNRT